MTRTLLKNIDNIPALPETVQEVERIYNDENSTLEDMQKAINKDPLVTANILRIANSPMYGLKTQVTTIKQATSLLGRESIRMFVMSSVTDSFDINLAPYEMNKIEFTTACDKQLSLMIYWLLRRKPYRLALLGPAAFLVDIGRVVIAKTLIEDGKEDIITQAVNAGEDIAKAEKKACGAQTTDVTATLFTRWNFNPDIVHLIRYSDDPEGAVHEDREMAAELKAVRETILPNGEITEESIATAKETIEEFGLDLISYERSVERLLAS